MVNNQTICQFNKLSGSLSPKTSVKRNPIKDSVNLLDGQNDAIEGISLCRKYSKSQIRRINRLTKYNHKHPFSVDIISNGKKVSIKYKKLKQEVFL